MIWVEQSDFLLPYFIIAKSRTSVNPISKITFLFFHVNGNNVFSKTRKTQKKEFETEKYHFFIFIYSIFFLSFLNHSPVFHVRESASKFEKIQYNKIVIYTMFDLKID